MTISNVAICKLFIVRQVHYVITDTSHLAQDACDILILGQGPLLHVMSISLPIFNVNLHCQNCLKHYFKKTHILNSYVHGQNSVWRENLCHLWCPLGCINTLNLWGCYSVCTEQIRHINNHAGGALMQQLSLSSVIHNDRAGGAGCVGLLSITWWHLAAQGITTPGPTVKHVYLCH